MDSHEWWRSEAPGMFHAGKPAIPERVVSSLNLPLPPSYDKKDRFETKTTALKLIDLKKNVKIKKSVMLK